MSDETEELNRLATSFSTTIRQYGEQTRDGLRTLSAALDQAADRLSAVMPGGPGSPVPAAPAAPAGAPAGTLPGGILSVRVVNERGAPVPVVMINPPDSSQGRTGLIGGIASGIGNFFGGLIGGIFGGIAAPFVGLADAIVLVTGATTVLVQVRGLLREIRAFATELVRSIRGLIELLFRELTTAGIFPVSHLIAALLFLIDRGITLVLAHVQPLIVWVERVLETVIAWLGTFVDRLSRFVGALVNELGRWLTAFLDHLIQTVVRPAVATIVRDAIRALVDATASVLIGVVLGLASVMREVFTWAWGTLVHLLGELARAMFPLLPVPVPPAPAAPDVVGSLRTGFAAGAPLGRALAEALLGPAKPATPPGAKSPAGAPAGAGDTRFHAPGFRAPELHLPDMPQPQPLLERIMGAPPAQPAPTATGQAPSTTLNGGVTVNIHAERVDLDTAEETARTIAAHVLEELNRLVEADRFRRGLATAAVA